MTISGINRLIKDEIIEQLDKAEQFLEENGIAYQKFSFRNILRVYFKYSSGHSTEYILDLSNKTCEMGLTTKAKTNLKEIKILNKLFELWGWFDE